MEEEKHMKSANGDGNLEEDKATNLQEKIEEKISEDETKLTGEVLSGELSKHRTHMSEHRTKMSEHRTKLSEHRTDLSDKRTVLSYQRTALSYERTLMSWIRTATSLISFGFTIYKFFEEVRKTNAHPSIITPRIVGMIMISFGFLGLLFAQLQHNIAYGKLKKEYPEIERSLSSILSMLILAVGLILFMATLFRQ
jgi:putative membrane protein